ncbi:MAG: hypothetical protein ACR2OB_01125 [Solirubrobacteraceae bacterium]
MVTGPAAELGSSTATLTGAVNPNGASTRWLFQYGLSTSYGSETSQGTVPAGVPMTVSTTVQGLEAGAAFHYRLLGLHGASVFAFGNDQTFVTYPSPRPVPRIRANTKPRRARRKPYVLTTYATIEAPPALPREVACGDGGSVGIRGARWLSASCPCRPTAR